MKLIWTCEIFLNLTCLIVFAVSHEYQTCEYRRPNCANVREVFRLYPSFRDKRTPDLIEMYGYPVETHEVVTEDGYILTVFRIPFSKASPPSPDKIPVFCMHGGFSSSAQWFWQPSNRALVFMLVDAGYDVWIGNARGTSYSQKHVYLSSKELLYWNFSQQEYGKYDDPAVIKYITKYTSQPSLYWIGHSLGGGQIFVALALQPELKHKIRTIFALAPAVYAGNSTNAALRILTSINQRYSFVKFSNLFGNGRFIPKFIAPFLSVLTSLCRISFVDCGICGNLIYLILGYSCQMDLKTLPGIAAHLPDVSSSKTESHFGQWVQTGQFKQYDYGRNLNKQMYGTTTPPHYDWANVDVPVVIYYSDKDNVIVPEDALKTAVALGPNLKEFNRVEFPHFNHIDFIVGIDADKLVYNKIIHIMNTRKYDKNYK